MIQQNALIKNNMQFSLCKTYPSSSSSSSSTQHLNQTLKELNNMLSMSPLSYNDVYIVQITERLTRLVLSSKMCNVRSRFQSK